MLVGYGWEKKTRYAGKEFKTGGPAEAPVETFAKTAPSVLLSFLPVIIPIILIGIRSFLIIETGKVVPAWMRTF